MFHFKSHAGYGLITLLLLLIAMVSSALGIKVYQQSKVYALQDELIIETLHQTRMGIMRYFQKYGHWPLQPFPDAVYEYVEHIELQVSNEPALRVRLSSADRVKRVQPYMAASWQHGSELWLRLATEPEGIAEDEVETNPNWLQRVGDTTAAMNTNLAMKNFAISDIQSLFAENFEATNLTSSEIKAGALTSSSLQSAEVESKMLLANRLDTNQFHSDLGSSQRVHAGIANVNSMLNVDAWQQQQIRMQETTSLISSFTQAAAVNATANSVYASDMDAQNLRANALNAERAHLSNLTTNEVTFSVGQVNHANAQTLDVNTASSNNATAQNVVVNSAVTLRGVHAQTLDSLHDELDILYRNLYNCVYENRWCEAPKPTNLILQQCQGCNQEHSNENFVANIAVSGHECVHGCEFEVHVSGANGACSPQNVAPRQNGNTTCTVSKQLAPGEAWQQMARVRARNGKDLNVWQDLPIMLNWQRTVANCPSFQVQEPIQGTEPLTFTDLVFAVTAAGNTATVTKSGIGCANMGGPWHCNGSAQCSASGQWQNVQTYCGCGF
ncbi:hypothetical protein A28LD_0180 [Idiomarina sp. A28L]|uniref:hypothetical protein n=1 Tax=Idiomarina sp. A28L TaxID=1036674 RepID=UPI00021387C6|nr:hypothetical protein [Idiomarina sp. A28L]EGN76437.1 hypothetical protein A28LD_0180 [Idiomarina sp. A28L]